MFFFEISYVTSGLAASNSAQSTRPSWINLGITEDILFWDFSLLSRSTAQVWVITNIPGYHVVQSAVCSVAHTIFIQKTDLNEITIIWTTVTCTPSKTLFKLPRLHWSPSDDIHPFLSVAVQWFVRLLLFRKVLATNNSYFYVRGLPQSVYANNRLGLQFCPDHLFLHFSRQLLTDQLAIRRCIIWDACQGC